jgi:glycosyltransferase involved in cell wall biosynthesis
VYAALACGCPVIFTGVGPTDELLASFSSNFAGVAVPYDIDAVAEAMLTAASHPLTPRDREQLAEEATARHSLKAIATVVVQEAARVAHSS